MGAGSGKGPGDPGASEELAAACFGRINATATARDLVNDRDRVVAVASHGRAAVTDPGWSLPPHGHGHGHGHAAVR